MEDSDKIKSALDIAIQYAQIDGSHHKMWVIDQMVRALTGDRYEEFLKEFFDGDEEDEWIWDEGIAP